MNVSLSHFSLRIGLGLCLSSIVVHREANAQLSGLFQSVPGTLAAYEYQANGIQTVMLPVDLTLVFSNDNPTSMLTATIIKPIIGSQADGTPLYPIASIFPMRVTATSQNGQDFHGDLLGSQYLFDWKIEPADAGELLLNGRVYWAGGRIELTTINNAPLIPAVAGDYNRDGTVDAADYIIWRNNEGTTNPLPNDPIGGTIGLAHYNQWRANFGQTAGTGAATSVRAAVPEPATLVLLLLSVASCCPWRRRTRSKSQQLINA
jgi:hypothetical protein